MLTGSALGALSTQVVVLRLETAKKKCFDLVFWGGKLMVAVCLQ